MARFADYVELATRCLRSDPFVHYDVGQELEAHLEDAAAEARAEGATEEQAREQALEAFGDPEALSEQLYEANRARMRLRWWGKWVTRLALVPAALVVAVLVGMYGFAVAASAAQVAGRPSPLMWFADHSRASLRRGLSEEERWLYEQVMGGPQTQLEEARLVAQRFPDDPVVHAFYVRHLTERTVDGSRFRSDGSMAEALYEEWMDALARGRELDPQNALYDYLLAYTLLVRATEVADEEGITFRYQEKGWRARPGPVDQELPTLRVTNREMFLSAAEAAQAGFRKWHCTARARDWAARMQGLWVEPETYRELLSQWCHHWSVVMPHLYPLRHFARRLPGVALLLGEMGRRDEAVKLAQRMDRPAVQMGADAGPLISILVARAMYTYAAGAAPEVLEELGEPEAARAAERRFEDEMDAYAAAVPARGHPGALEEAVMTEGGLVAQMVAPVLSGIEVQPLLDTTRLAEHVLLERLALAGLLALGSAVLLVLAAATAWSAWRHREPDGRPMMLFVGWRRLAVVLLVGMALPLALYALQTRVAPWRSLRYGLHRMAAQRGAELWVAAVLIVSLTGVFAYRAVRARCEKAGLPVPPAGWFSPLPHRGAAAMSLLLAGAFGAVAAGIVARSLVRDTTLLLGVAGLVAAGMFVPIFLVWQFAHLGYSVRPFRTIARELLSAAWRTPIWLIALGLVLFGVGGFLLWATYAIPSWLHLVIIFGIALVLPLVVYGCARTQFVAPDRLMARFRRTAFRSLLPVAAACVVVLGLVANLYLAHAEAAALEPVTRTAYHVYNEIERTDLAAYRDHLRQVNRRWLESHGEGPAQQAHESLR